MDHTKSNFFNLYEEPIEAVSHLNLKRAEQLRYQFNEERKQAMINLKKGTPKVSFAMGYHPSDTNTARDQLSLIKDKRMSRLDSTADEDGYTDVINRQIEKWNEQKNKRPTSAVFGGIKAPVRNIKRVVEDNTSNVTAKETA